MMVERLEQKKRRGAYATWGNTFYKSLPNIAPLRGALAVWGLGVDDIQVASFHGTSTNARDVPVLRRTKSMSAANSGLVGWPSMQTGW